ncbi:MAG: hypothetical protein HGA45_41065, partial [Chloroflexales bacterium]|nr:hypothetical protein [Chloroflexales bacterium]
MLTPLPIDPRLSEIVERLRSASGLVLQAEPGAGKTTRVPSAVLEAGIAGDRVCDGRVGCAGHGPCHAVTGMLVDLRIDILPALLARLVPPLPVFDKQWW